MLIAKKLTNMGNTVLMEFISCNGHSISHMKKQRRNFRNKHWKNSRMLFLMTYRLRKKWVVPLIRKAVMEKIYWNWGPARIRDLGSQVRSQRMGILRRLLNRVLLYHSKQEAKANRRKPEHNKKALEIIWIWRGLKLVTRDKIAELQTDKMKSQKT